MKNKNIIITGIIALLIGGGVGFFGGMKYQQSKTLGRATGMFQRGTGLRNMNGMAVRGQIISADTNSITVKMPDGSTKIVILSSTTMIGKTTTGSATDLTTGVNVIVFGNTNSDGSVTAQNVQVGNGMLFGRPNGPSGSPAASPVGY